MAIVAKDNERLYLDSWEYNVARILTQLAKDVENKGGRVKYGKSAVITNRTLEGDIRQKLQRLERINDRIRNDKKVAPGALKKIGEDLHRLKGIQNDPITVTHTSYITFLLQERVYYLGINENPFFEHHYWKTPLKGDLYSRDRYREVFQPIYEIDDILKYDFSETQVQEASKAILESLVNSPISGRSCERHKKKVPNTYNGGYHYETVTAPERFVKIDF